MTPDEARRRAVEAAVCETWEPTDHDDPHMRGIVETAIAAFERAMADAGWRWVRDVGGADAQRPWDNNHERREGWNACRRAMLGEGE